MSIITCERCGDQVAKAERCSSCNKLQCMSCIKSAKKKDKVKHYFICKDCWSNMKARRSYKAK